MADASRGPPLDDLATSQILKEDDRHRQMLINIEKAEASAWSEMLAAENALHLRELTRIYSELAERRLEQQLPATPPAGAGGL